MNYDGDWPHQIRGVKEIISCIETGEKRICVTSPTGGGKSRILLRICEYAIEQGWTVAVFTNRKLLTNQLSKGLSKDGIHVGVRAAEFESWTDLDAPVQICSTPTEAARVLRKRERAVEQMDSSHEEANERFKLFPARLIIVDEAHMNKADTMTAILDEYSEKHDSFRLGVTATPLGIGHLYDKLIVAGNNSELRETGSLVVAKCYEPAVFDLHKIKRTKTGIYSQKEMDEAVKAIWSQHVVGHIYDHWKKLNPDGKPSLGMAPGVKESLGLAVEYWNKGVNAAHISSEGLYVDGKQYTTTEQEDREEIFERSRNGDVPIIWNRYVLREALNLPWLEHLILATPIASLLSYIQVCGRVLRSSAESGKTNATVCDHAGSIRTHGSPNLDRDQDWIKYFKEQEDKMSKDRIDRLRDPDDKEAEPITCPNCGSIRKSGRKCLECGFQHDHSTRKVIQENGTLKPMTGDVFPKRQTKMKYDTVQKWTACYFRCKNAKKPMTFKQARALFKYEEHYWPPMELHYMPKNKSDWGRRINDVSKNDLHQDEKFKAV